MPSKAAHLHAAKMNQRTIEFLWNSNNDEHLPWVVTVAFYKALHVVEAVLALEPSGEQQHFDSHETRNRMLKRTRKFQKIYELYIQLYQQSQIARYLTNDVASSQPFDFAKYLPRKKVEELVLNHWLRQIQNSASRLTNDNDFLGV